MENAKLGVYICTGCGIGDAVNAEALTKVAQGYKPVLCKTRPCLCSEEDRRLIDEEIQREGLNTLCLAACSPRAKAEVFDFDPEKVVCERVNLREGVAWVSEPKHEDTQALAEDYLRMGLVRAQRMDLLAPYEAQPVKTILVVGGGAAGLSAALTAARAGYQVVLVESAERLGGFLRGSYRRFPHSAPYHEPEPPPVAALAAEAQKHPLIAVRTGTVVVRTEGQPGELDVTLKGPDGESKVRVGAVVLATGFTLYDATKLSHLGYGQPNVVTCADLEGTLGEKGFARPNGYPASSVGFILCAGSRDPQHLPYCSSVCCRTALKQALLIRRASPETKVYLFYKDLRAPGLHEEFYRHVQRDPGIFLLKGEVSSVTPERKSIKVDLERTMLGERVQVEVDLLVLATGIQPRGVGGLAGEGAAARAEAAAAPAESALNLSYRQGPNPPVSEVGFADSKFICFPYETRRTAFFAAGCVREPMDSGRAVDDGAGAAMKAMQAVELLAEKRALHPRAGDLSFPSFFLQRCTQCKRCTEECPFGALDEDAKGTPKPNPGRCRRCGVCMGACPERIVSFANYSVPMIGNALKEIEVPDAEDEKPRIVALACENDACPALDIAAMNRLRLDPTVRVQPVRCLGSMNIVWIADCLSKGIDAVLLLGCKFGDDLQCHFIKGSELASKRLENLQETLNRLMLDSNRIRLEQVSITDYDRIVEVINAFAAEVKEMEPNPYKGF